MNAVITDAARINARVLLTSRGNVSSTGRDGTTPRDRNFYGPVKWSVLIGVTTVSPTIIRSQDIDNPHGSTGSVEVGDTQIFDTSIDGNLAENGNSMPIFSKLIRQEISHNYSNNIYLRCTVEFMSNFVGTKAPDFMYLGLPAVNASDKLRSFSTPLPDLEGQRMDPTGMRRAMFL